MISKEYAHGRPMEIGTKMQFVFDDVIVEDRWKLTRKLGTVNKYIHNPVLYKTKPWEGSTIAAILIDPETGIYKAWYTGFSISGYFDRKNPSYYICYAESEDGYTWTRPLFEEFPFGSWKKTNVIYKGRTGLDGRASQVFLNPDTADPSKKYMLITNKVDLAYSPDGIHWSPSDKPLIECGSDTHNHLVWVEEEKLWHLYLRPPIRPNADYFLPEGHRHLGRRLALSTSPDLKEWSRIRTIMYTDELEDNDIDSTHVFRRNGTFFCIYDNMHQDAGGSEKELYLATSRDGINWERSWDRSVFVPRGEKGEWDAGQIHTPASGPLEIGEDLVFYYGGSPVGQHSWEREDGCGLFQLRRDRFIGQRAEGVTGYLVTRQFLVQGNRLLLNYSAVPRAYKEPEIRVEIIEYPELVKPEGEWEKKIPGFTFGDCDPLKGDRLDQPVTWKGSPDLSRLRGKPVYLRFKIWYATLYGFQISE